MNSISTLKLAGSIKPPASKSEIIEALAIRKRGQIITENAALVKELEQLEIKLQVACAEEMAKSGKLKPNKYSRNGDFNCHAQKDSDNRLTVSEITCDYFCPPTEEIRNIAKRIWEIRQKNIRHEPTLSEVRRQVRAAITEQTPPDKRIHQLLHDPESQKMLDTVLGALDGKPKQLAIAV